MIHIAADLHLRPCIWKGHPEINGDQFKAWATLCKTVANDKEGALILAGDIFDTPNPSGTTEYAFKRGMELLAKAGRPCWFIPGNHDNEEIPRPYLFGARLLDERIRWGNLTIAGVPFTRSTEALHSAIESLPPTDLLILHTGFRHLLGFNETWQISAEDIPDSIKKVFAGHVHVHSEEGKVYSPGSLALHRADEIDKGHGFFSVADDGTVKWTEVFTRQFVPVDVHEGFSLDSLVPLAESSGGTAVVLLNYQNTLASVADAIQEYYKGRLLFVCNARAAERAQVVEDTDTASFDPKAVAAAYLSEHLNNEERSLAESIMTAEDPSKAIEEYLCQ